MSGYTELFIFFGSLALPVYGACLLAIVTAKYMGLLP